jgi:hypothetical protein
MSLDCPFLVASSVFSSVYLQFQSCLVLARVAQSLDFCVVFCISFFCLYVRFPLVIVLSVLRFTF